VALLGAVVVGRVLVVIGLDLRVGDFRLGDERLTVDDHEAYLAGLRPLVVVPMGLVPRRGVRRAHLGLERHGRARHVNVVRGGPHVA